MTRRRFASGVLSVTIGSEAAKAQSPWAALCLQLETAERALHSAQDQLALMERRYIAVPRRQQRKGEPDWYVAAQASEAQACVALNAIYLRISEATALDVSVLALKLRLLASAHGMHPDREQDDEARDLASRLIRSLLREISALLGHKAI